MVRRMNDDTEKDVGEHSCSSVSYPTFRGLTYPHRIIRFGWQSWLWRKVFCKREIHLFDEVLSGGSEDPVWDHYLVCDACQLMVGIAKISDEYVGV